MTPELVDLPALRAFLVAHAVPGLDEVDVLADGSSRHRRLLGGHAGATTTLTVTLPPGVVGSPSIGAEGEPDAVAASAAVGRRWLGLDADPAAGVAALADDPVLGPLVLARPHLRVPGSTDPFETAVLVVLGQHVSLAAGRVFAARLVAAHGEQRGGQLRTFPSPEALAALEATDLQRTVGVTTARAGTVVAIARAVADGTLPLGLAPAPDLAEVRQRML
ncbi:MAG TPA: AlkA N-terminal domain-containing protein, partial [Ornithinibacter sp.]|nr:AlkA N-terminal domain-containing protein [Ornithinibacter sp.]